jgi:hypothetical protein
MPKQKDLKRRVRARMQKTGEAYTAARLQILKKAEPRADYPEVAGMSDAAIGRATGRTWAEWVRLLDESRAMEKPHREIVSLVASLGTPSWWTQMVTVGYERIRGLRARGQQRSGLYEAGKSRTFNVPIDALYAAFANTRTRQRWLTASVTVKSASPHKRMRFAWGGDAVVEVAFTAKGDAKSVVTFTQRKLPTKAAADAVKKTWGDHLDRLGGVFA